MRPQPTSASARGIVLLALLLALALMTIGMLQAAEWWSTMRQREAEAELLYVGDQYRQAIAHYYYASPTPVKTLPSQLQDLLQDPRFPMPVRHLRKLYPDPVGGDAFDVLHDGAAIIGVASKADRPPLKRHGFPAPYGGFDGQESYTQWKFVFVPPAHGRALPPRQPGPAGIPSNGVRP